MKQTERTRKASDLLSWPLIGFLFTNRYLIFALRLFLLALLLSALYFGIVYPDEASNPYTRTIFWSLFWPFFIIVSLATLGPIFCGICPHSFLGKYLNKMGPKLTMPTWLKQRWIGLSLLLLLYWLPLYTFPGFFNSPLITALFFLVLSIFAWSSFYLFKNMDYCAHLCPIGSITNAYGKVGFARLGTDRSFCDDCTTFECAKACPWHLSPFLFDKKNAMNDCRLCMACSQACNAVEFRLQKPSKQLLARFDKETIITHLYIWMLAVITITMNFRHSLGHSPIKDQLPWVQAGNWLNSALPLSPFDWNGLTVVASAVALTYLIIYGSFALSAKIAKVPFQTYLHAVAPMLAPLMLISLFAHVCSAFFFSYASKIANAWFWLIGSQTLMPPLVARGSWAAIFGLLAYVALIWSAFVLYKRIEPFEAQIKRKAALFLISGSIIWFYLFLLMFRILLPRG